MKTSSCPVCEAAIIGRSDKKYCSDQCRAVANRENKIRSEQKFLTVNQTLRKNRNILHKLCPYGKTIVRREVLETLGFNLNYFTSILITKNRHVYYICYDYGFTAIRDSTQEKALIVPMDANVKNFNPWNYVRP